MDSSHQALTHPFADCQELHGVASLSSCLDGHGGNRGDALAVNLLHRNLGVECQRGQNCGLARSVVALDVSGWICLGVTKSSCLGQCLFEVSSGGLHAVQDEVSCSVHNSHDTVDLVTGKGFAQRTDDWDCAAYGSLEVELCSKLLCKIKELRPMGRNQRFVGGDYVGTGLKRHAHISLCGLDTTQKFNNDVRTKNQGLRIRCEELAWNHGVALGLGVSN